MKAPRKAARKRRSSTAASPISVAPSNADNESLRTRKISNGWLLTREGSKRGKYFQHDEYSPTRPVVTASKPTRNQGRATASRTEGKLKG